MRVHDATCHSDDDCVAGELDMLGNGQCASGAVGREQSSPPSSLECLLPQGFGLGAVCPITMGPPKPARCPPGAQWRMGPLSGVQAYRTPLSCSFLLTDPRN
jgi:hypothetical protein